MDINNENNQVENLNNGPERPAETKRSAKAKQKTRFDIRKNAAFNYIMLALLGGGTGVLSLLLGATLYGLPLFQQYFSLPVLILLNLVPPVLLVLLAYFISGRAWISFTIPSLLVLSLSAIQFFKVQLRGDPFVAVDLALITETGNIISAYSLTMNWKIYFVIAAFICGVVFSVFVLKRKEKKPAVRIAGTFVLLIASVLLYSLVYMDADLYDRTEGGFDAKQWSFSEKFISKGFMYPFIHSIRYAFPEVPDGYGKSDAKALLSAYNDRGIPDEKKVNIISIMLEAYTDMSVFDAIDFEIDVYGPLHRLQRESVSGSLINNIFGGGTIDTERLFLTGFTKLTNYSSATNSYVHYLNDQGYYTEGMHAGDNWFYDRSSVNAHLGFKNYYFLDDYEVSSRNDSFFFPAVKALYDARDKKKPYFSYNLSYQNHGAYESGWTDPPYYLAQDGLSDESFNILNNYLSGIYDTTLRIESFIDSLRNDPEPVVVVIFGDHMPWLGNYESVYNELGINVDIGTEEGIYNLYSTPYIIWANDAAQKTLGNSFTGTGGSFSPCYLMGEVFRRCSWEGSSYMQALRALKDYTDVINTPTGLFRENNELVLDLSEDAKKVWNNFRKIEYYRLHNFSYSAG